MARFGLGAVLVLLADLLTKWVAFKALQDGPTSFIPGLLDLRLAPLNTGAVFSIGRGLGPLFILFTLVAGVGIVWVAWTHGGTSRLLSAGLSLVLVGALGNLWDRLWHGGVRDFIDVYVGQRHWPTFNVADMAICTGAGIIILYSFKTRRPEEKHKNGVEK